MHTNKDYKHKNKRIKLFYTMHDGGEDVIMQTSIFKF